MTCQYDDGEGYCHSDGIEDCPEGVTCNCEVDIHGNELWPDFDGPTW